MRSPILIAALLLGVASAQTPTTELPVTTRPGPTGTAQPSAVTLRDVPAGHWARSAVEMLVQQGLLLGFPEGTYRGGKGITRYEAAVIFYRFLSGEQFADARLTGEQVQTLSRGLLEVADELKVVAGRVDAIERKDAVQDARLGAIEGALARINDSVVTLGQTSATVVGERLNSLERTVQTLPELTRNLTPRSEHDALGARVAALEGRGASVPGQVAPLLPFPGGGSGPAARSNVYGGVGADLSLSSEGRFGVSAVLGARELVGPIGAQAALSYNFGSKALSVEAAGTLHFGNPLRLSPYLGAGVGTTFGPGRSSTGNTSDLYGLGLAGLGYNVTSRLGFFAEGNLRYYLSNQGVGTGLAPEAGKGLGGGARIGLRVNF